MIFSAFLLGIFAIAVKNFGSDAEILVSSGTRLRTLSAEEKTLIDDWLAVNNAGISIKGVGYRNIIKKYPSKPWLEK